jgi:hypothetical protein
VAASKVPGKRVVPLRLRSLLRIWFTSRCLFAIVPFFFVCCLTNLAGLKGKLCQWTRRGCVCACVRESERDRDRMREETGELKGMGRCAYAVCLVLDVDSVVLFI